MEVLGGLEGLKLGRLRFGGFVTSSTTLHAERPEMPPFIKWVLTANVVRPDVRFFLIKAILRDRRPPIKSTFRGEVRGGIHGGTSDGGPTFGAHLGVTKIIFFIKKLTFLQNEAGATPIRWFPLH